MIIYEPIHDNLVRAYSDLGVLIHGGDPEADYEEAIDPVDKHRTYIETDIPIPTGEEIEEPRRRGRIGTACFFSYTSFLPAPERHRGGIFLSTRNHTKPHETHTKPHKKGLRGDRIRRPKPGESARKNPAFHSL